MDSRNKTFEEWLMNLKPPKIPEDVDDRNWVVKFTEEELHDIAEDAAWIAKSCDKKETMKEP